MDSTFWRGRSVFVTGHTGFKGAWLCLLLAQLGAKIHGYALETPPTFLYTRAKVAGVLEHDERGDIRELDRLSRSIKASGAEFVLHLAAQSVVRESYRDPRETFSTNVDGTLSVLQAAHAATNVRGVVVVTTDKVYRNNEWHWGYRETDPLGGDDPYSASKAAAELVTHSFAVSYPRDGLAIASARAGNVIGGGDATPDALIPDVIKGLAEGRQPVIRRPAASRPWQHVLEPLTGYLTLASRLGAETHDTAWNFGPAAEDCVTVGTLVDRLSAMWGSNAGYAVPHVTEGPHEAGLLVVDSAKARAELGWAPTLRVQQALQLTVDWEQSVAAQGDPRTVTDRQIAYFLAEGGAA
mgnify:CR=1 FL=1